MTLTFGAFTNAGEMHVDAISGDGGSAVTFSGELTNSSNLIIGNSELSASTRISAPTLDNLLQIIVQGNAANGATQKASLVLVSTQCTQDLDRRF